MGEVDIMETPEITTYGANIDDFHVLSRKYQRLKEELHNVFWKHSIKTDPELSSIPEETRLSLRDKTFEYKISSFLGNGQFGSVYRAERVGILYAVKNIDKKKIRTYEQLSRLAREISIVKSIDHPNIIVLHNVINTPESLLIFFSLGDCDIFDLQGNNILPPKSLHIMTEQLIEAVAYLDRNNIAHRDIKPENIICSNKDELISGKIDASLDKTYIKLVDFGLAVKYSNLPFIVGTSYKLRDFCGSPGFFAPEILYKKGYNNKVDWWSTGCVILEFAIKNVKFSKEWMPLYTPVNIKSHSVFLKNMCNTLPKIKKIVNEDALHDTYLANIIENTLLIEPERRSLYH